MVSQMVHKNPGRKRRTAALAAAAILVLLPLATACGDDNGDGAVETPPVPTPTAIAPTTVQPTGTPPAEQPADPAAARQEIEENWATFFNAQASTDDRIDVLENGEQLRQVFTNFADDPNASRTSAKVTDVTFASPTRAEVTYDLMVGTATPLPAAKGTAVLEDDTWKVSQTTLCALVKLSGNAAAVPGC
ncbi:hypothetical protein [Streptomyces sp. TRM64462]|uniref:hypothetical protein n=1 Tax=Streptomyces sp. TRM64462 TaxID=2741726 RepID=UPI001586D82B|nr:hypothetical protein [Streptomyces sp. TRM64462]